MHLIQTPVSLDLIHLIHLFSSYGMFSNDKRKKLSCLSTNQYNLEVIKLSEEVPIVKEVKETIARDVSPVPPIISMKLKPKSK